MINLICPLKNLSNTNKLIINSVNKFSRELLPNYLVSHEYKSLYKELGNLGILGCQFSSNNCLGVNKKMYGLIAKELEYIDSGFRGMYSVQSSLVMGALLNYGNKKLIDMHIDELRTGNKIGCFGLTEPDSGSDVANMKTYAKLDNGDFLINGNKTWITNAPIADILIIWAKYKNRINGFLLEKDMPGLTTVEIKDKLSMKSSPTGMIFMDNVRVPKINHLNTLGMNGPLNLINNARLSVALGSLGAAESCIDIALDYTQNRKLFGSYLCEKQLIQDKLVNMITEYNLAFSLSLNIIDYIDDNELKPHLVSIIKRNNPKKALEIARNARDILGGNGITKEYNIFRHLVNLETVNTYEGTHDIHTLILGKHFTGYNAF